MTTGAPPPTARRRSRARTFLPLAVAAWLILEVWLLTVIADAASGFAVLALLVGAGVLGAVVVKRAGRRAFANLTRTLQQQTGQGDPATSMPSGRAEGNGLLMLGGLLLMLPGVASDAAGLLLLLPPVRTRLGRLAERSLERRMNAAMPDGLGNAFQQARIHRPDGKVVQGEVIRDGAAPRRDDDAPRPPLTP